MIRRMQELTIGQKRAIWAWGFLALPVVFYATVRFYPTVEALRASFTSWNFVGRMEYIGVANYTRLAQYPAFWKVIGNTFAYLALGVPISMLLSFVIAYFNARLDKALKSRGGELVKLLDYARRKQLYDSTASALASVVTYENSYFQKLVASLYPFLEKVTTGETPDLVSPDYENLDDPRPVFDWMTILNNGGIVYVTGSAEAAESRVFDAMQAARPALGVTLVSVIIDSPTQPDVTALLSMARADALYVLPNSINNAHATTISNFAAANRLPTMYSERDSVEAGGLVSCRVNWLDLRRHAAIYVDCTSGSTDRRSDRSCRPVSP